MSKIHVLPKNILETEQTIIPKDAIGEQFLFVEGGNGDSSMRFQTSNGYVLIDKNDGSYNLKRFRRCESVYGSVDVCEAQPIGASVFDNAITSIQRYLNSKA